MIGLVLVTHGKVGVELLAAMEHVVGKQTHTKAISIGPEDDMQGRRSDILAAVKETDAGEGVIVVTDMFGGTPSNLAISIMEQAKVEVISGANLPMLIKLASTRASESLHAAALGAQEAGRKYITLA
jgi:PTS system mannose-specific IIA component